MGQGRPRCGVHRMRPIRQLADGRPVSAERRVNQDRRRVGRVRTRPRAKDPPIFLWVSVVQASPFTSVPMDSGDGESAVEPSITASSQGPIGPRRE